MRGAIPVLLGGLVLTLLVFGLLADRALVVPFPPYAKRPRAELSRLLSSDRVTPSGLPEAVVARLALGDVPPVSGADPPPNVAERLLSGQLPVRPETSRTWRECWVSRTTRGWEHCKSG